MPTTSTNHLEHLREGEISIDQQVMWGSNHTLLSIIDLDSHTIKAIYKPIAGEAPLWDFPRESLAGREVAAYLVSQAIGWNFIPTTVFRPDAPSGPGSLQLFIEHDPNYHYFNFKPEDRKRLLQVALFDALINNTDRKGGHIIIDPKNKIWLIDHGICFHTVPKLRTVIWDFAGQPISDKDCQSLIAFQTLLEPETEIADQLKSYLTEPEIQAIRDRNNKLISHGRYPSPQDARHSFPWPPV